MNARTRLSGTRVSAALFLFLASLFLATMGGHTYAQDDESFYYVSESILTRGEFDIPSPRTHPTVGGHHGREGLVYAQSSLGQPLLATPFYVAGQILANGFDARYAGLLRRGVMNILNPLVSAGLAIVLLAYARALGWSVRAGAAIALIWALATPAWIEAKTFYNEPLMALLLVLSFYFLKRAQQTQTDSKIFLASVFWGMSAVTRIHAAVALPALVIYFFLLWNETTPFRTWRERAVMLRVARSLFLFLVPGAVLVALGAFGYNFYRFGDWFEFGYGETLAPIPIWTGIYGILFSSGKSWLLFAPPLVASLLALRKFFRAHRPETIAFVVYVTSVILFHARYDNWHSAGAWGDRYLFAATALWMLPLGDFFYTPKNVLSRAVLATTVVLGIFVQLLAVPINFDVYINSNLNEPKRLFEWSSAPMLAHARLLGERATMWWNVWNAPAPRVVLLDGWLASDGGEELFPRYIAPRARLGIASNENATLRVRVVTADYRPANLPRRALEFFQDETKLDAGVMQTERAEAVYAFSIPPPHAPLVWLTLETRGTELRGNSPMGDELGLYAQDILITADDERVEFFPEIAIPPNPLTIPNASWSWFYNPQLPHWDFWWWYLYFSGLPRRDVWSIILPGVLLSGSGVLMGAVWLWRALKE